LFLLALYKMDPHLEKLRERELACLSICSEKCCALEEHPGVSYPSTQSWEGGLDRHIYYECDDR